MDDTVVMEVCDSRKSRSDQVGGIRLVVRSFSTNAIKEFTTEGEVGDEIY